MDLMMFKINDYLVYGTTGVCQVLDIKEEQFLNDEPRDYYILNQIFSQNTVIKIPVEHGSGRLRNLYSKEEIATCIKGMPDHKPLYIEDDRERAQAYRSLLKTGDCDDLITLINSIYYRKNAVVAPTKKYNKNDDDLMKRAQNLLNEEFAVVLGINPDEVKSYILEQIPQN